jgi:hypothetical protein
MSDDKVNLLVRGLPISLIHRAKAAARLERKTFRIWLVEAMHERMRKVHETERHEETALVKNSSNEFAQKSMILMVWLESHRLHQLKYVRPGHIGRHTIL